MSSSLQTFSNSLLSTRCHGRVLEVICPNEKLAEAISENNRNILVLIEDKLYSLDYQGNAELSPGSLLSFEIGETGEVVEHKTGGSTVNLEAEGDLLR